MDKNIQKYMAFVKTVEYGSFTKAAEILNYSQSGISRMINDLEQEWKLTLLERSKHGVRLTSEGTQLLPYANSLCSEYEKLLMAVDELNGLQSGIIRIGTFSSVATHWLPNIIKAFQKDYPNIQYELLMGEYIEIEEWIASGTVDCGFLRLPACQDFDTVPLLEEEFMAILPEDHPLASCDKFPIEALSNDPLMLFEKTTQAEMSEIFGQYDLSPNVPVTVWDDYAIMSMVEKGLGISILPELVLQRVPYRIVTKKLEVPAYRRLGLAMQNREKASLAMKRFLEYLDFRDCE